ncbi:MAG: peptidylprolyl isomerase [Kiritimatiellaeota bacterium]|nr:peptidylprolyl isomerase [Kiritimatiellota bacterium]
MKKAISLCAALMMASTCALTGRAAPGDPDEVVASVDGVTLLRKDMDKAIDTMMARQSSVPVAPAQTCLERKDLEKAFIVRFVINTLLRNAAEKEGITVTDEDMIERAKKMKFPLEKIPWETAREFFKDELLQEKLFQMKFLDAVEVDDAEVEKYIEEQKALKASIKIMEDRSNSLEPDQKAVKRAKIENLKNQLAGGADFAALVKEHSDCPSGKNGGALRTFRRGQMSGEDKPFEDAAFAQEVGKVGEVVETSYGYHLILVTAKNPATEANGGEPAQPETVMVSHILLNAPSSLLRLDVPTAEEARKCLKQKAGFEQQRIYLLELRDKAKIETVIPTKGWLYED